MRDHKWSRRRHCEFENKIVIRVLKERPPCKKYLLVIRQKANTVQDSPDVFGAESGQQSRPHRDCLILENQGHGHGNPKVAAPYRPQNLEAGPSL